MQLCLLPKDRGNKKNPIPPPPPPKKKTPHNNKRKRENKDSPRKGLK
jgi:hypothetical protein